MRIYGRGQLTLTDLNDAISSGTEPTNPSKGTLWIDESINPKVLKKWNGSIWIPVGEVMDQGTGETIVDITETLGNMANDNAIDFNERQIVKDKLTEIIGFVMNNDTLSLPTSAENDEGNLGKGSFHFVRKNALMAGLSIEDERYQNVVNKYNLLKSYLESLSPRAWDLTPSKKDLIINVVKDEFRFKWKDYFQSELDLANATAEQLRKNVDNVGIGGTNWASNGNFEIDISKSLWKSNYIGTIHENKDISTETPPFQFAYHVKQNTKGNGGIFTPTIWSGESAKSMIGKEIAISFWLKYSQISEGSGKFGEIVIEGEKSDGSKVYFNRRVDLSKNEMNESLVSGTDENWKKYYGILKIEKPADAQIITKISFKHGIEDGTGEFWTTGIKVEIGNKVSDWSQSPIDIQARLTDVEFKVTPEGIFLQLRESSSFNSTLASKESMRDFNFENGLMKWRANQSGSEELTGVSVVSGDSRFGANLLRINGEQTAFYSEPIPVDPTHVYKVTFRVRQIKNPTETSGRSKVFAGLAGFNANKTPLSTTTFGLHRFCATNGEKDIKVEDGWLEFVGTISGEGNEGYDQFIQGTRYVSPVFIVNSSGGDGIVEVDVCSVEDISTVDALANQLDSVVQSITPDGISTIISSSVFYDELQSVLDSKANAEDLGEYATNDYVDDYINNMDIDGKVSQSIENLNDDETSILRRTYATQQQLEQTSKSLTTKFSASGGRNILKNSIGFSDFITKAQADTGIQNWYQGGRSERIYPIQNIELDSLGFGSGFNIVQGTASTHDSAISQFVNTIPNQTYTLSWFLNKTNSNSDGSGHMDIYFIEDEDTLVRIPVSWDVTDEDGNITRAEGTEFRYDGAFTTNGYEMMSVTFTPTTNRIRLSIFTKTNFTGVITGLMLTLGDIPLQWSLATGEAYNTNVRLDINGIRVSQLDPEKTEIGYTQITPNEFAGYWRTASGNFERVFYLNGEETVTKKFRATDEISMGSLKIKNIDSGGNKGWAFVPVVK